jgi:hypothetical protein
MVKYIAVLVGLILVAVTPQSFACYNGPSYAFCSAGTCVANTPDSVTTAVANATITTASLCPGATIDVIGYRENPGGYKNVDTEYVVNSSLQAVFQSVDVSFDSVYRKVDPTLGTLETGMTLPGTSVVVIWGAH